MVFRKKHSEETKRRISEKLKGDNNPSKKQEVRQKISLALKGRKFTDEWKKNISISIKEAMQRPEVRQKFMNYIKNRDISGKNHPLYGKKLSEETKKKIGLKIKGRKHTQETKIKISQKVKGKMLGEKHPFYGKHHTLEAKRKISIGNKGKVVPNSIRERMIKDNPMKRPEIKAMFKGDKNPAKRLEVRKKISLKNKGRKFSEEFKQKISKTRKRLFKEGKLISPNLGKKLVKKHKERIAETRKKLYRDGKIIPYWKGKKFTKEHKEKLKQAYLKKVFPLKDTSIEVAMQKELRDRDIIFETHKPVIGQPDIFISPNVCVFCDGDYWHNLPKGIKRDIYVNQRLKEKGFFILRYWEHEIKTNVEGCVDEIIDVLSQKGNFVRSKLIK